MEKRGISPVVATVLLILLVLIIIFALAFFLIPNLRDSIFGSDACFNVINDVRFDEEGEYNCYYDSGSVQATSFSVRIDNENVIGFRVGLVSEGASNTLDVTPGLTSESLRMINGDFGAPLEVNNVGGVRTYVAKGLYERIDIFPILQSKVCTTTFKQYIIAECLNTEVQGQITTISGNTGSTAACGNRVLDPGEVCEPHGGVASCTATGNYPGTQECINCSGFSTCTGGSCGDGICQSPPETGASCPQDCGTITPSANCGNGVLDAGEECDGTNFGGETCQTQGFNSGTLVCTLDCMIETSQCSSSAGAFEPNNGSSGSGTLGTSGSGGTE